MAEYTKDEALAFVEAMRLTLTGKVGFKWLLERLSDLSAYIEAISAENERMRTYLQWSRSNEDFEAYCSAHRGLPDDDGSEPAV